MKTALVLGAGGFIGSHLVKRLKSEGFWVRGVDLKRPDFEETAADDFITCDLRDPDRVRTVMTLEAYEVHNEYAPLPYKFSQYPFSKVIEFDEVYQLAADMGGAGYIFTGDNDANIMTNSALINLNVLERCVKTQVGKVFYSSSACIYPAYNQLDPENPNCSENSAYPACPDSEYGWEKLFSERLYLSYHKNYKLNIRIARFHNIFGPEGSWNNGKEKSLAALCRKVAESNSVIDVWGDGKQTRSFLYIDECLEGIEKLMESNFIGPVNIGSDEMISINELANMIIAISGKKLTINNIKGPTGVRGRNSDNKLLFDNIGWKPSCNLKDGIEKTFYWINEQFKKLLYI